MKRLFFFLSILLFLPHVTAYAQGSGGASERLMVFTDKNCYLAGERMHVSVRLLPAGGDSAGRNAVAYVELADTAAMQTQAMVALTDGAGWASLPLPSALHSGNYMLTAYTRSMRNEGWQCFSRQIVSIVNAARTSVRDNVLFLSPDSSIENTLPTVRRRAGERVRVSLPADSAMTIHTLSVVRGDLLTGEYSVPENVVLRGVGERFVPEVEGHVVMARPVKAGATQNSRLVMVGKGTAVFDGVRQSDDTWLYLTHDIYGAQPTLLNGYTGDNEPAPMEFLSPYAQVLPVTLPSLQVWCNEEMLVQRSMSAQREERLVASMPSDTLPHTTNLLSSRPDYLYDLDEYTKFSSVKEILTEFVRGVRRRTVQGRTHLFVSSDEHRLHESWPALVLLDGMPVHDIDALLQYDAHLLKYVQVYSGVYSFGSTACQGVVSFISHRGRLSNFKLDEGSRLVTYTFPQQRPAFTLPEGGGLSTMLWDPYVEAAEAEFPAPPECGSYHIILQGMRKDGTPLRSVSRLEVGN